MTRFAQIDRLEEIFDALGVAYETRVLDVHRMRILRRFGRELLRIDGIVPRPDADEVRSLYAAALAEIHGQCRRGLREEVPLFRGLSEQLVQLRRGPKASPTTRE